MTRRTDITSKYPDWTEDELATLDKYYGQLTKAELMKLLPRRKWGSIRDKAAKRGHGILKRWTKEEEKFIRENHQKMTYGEIARKLARTEVAISARVGRMGLRKQAKPKKWSEDENEFLIKYYSARSTKELATILGRASGAVRLKANQLGLIKSKEFWDVIRQKSSEALKLKWTDEKFKEQHIKRLKDNWKNPEYRDKVREAIDNGLEIRPNKPESKLIEIFDEHFPGQIRYTGDRSEWVGWVNPDFMHTSERKVIEHYGDYWHDESRRDLKWTETEQGRHEYLAKHGYECLIIWEHELKDEAAVIARVAAFLET